MELTKILSRFPPISHAVAYGSAIMANAPADAQQDFIFAVDDSSQWHAENMTENSSDYSDASLKLGPEGLTQSAKAACGIHYNPYVQINEQMFKYGVVEKSDLLEDLNNWETLYLAGRFHKPMLTLQEDEEVTQAQQGNLKMALCTTVMLSRQTVPDTTFYTSLSGLSYHGDMRVEKGDKVKNMVEDNIQGFRDLYAPIWKELEEYIEIDQDVVMRNGSIEDLYEYLPELFKIPPILDMCLEDRQDLIQKILKNLNKRTSKDQIKHAWRTNTVSTVFKYSMRKIRKRFFK